MQRGRPTQKVILTAEERETLQRWTSQPKTAPALALRARIVLACAEGKSNTEVSVRMRLSMPSMGKWRSRCIAQRLEGLPDKPRPGAPRRISDASVERILTVTLGSMPRNATHWSTRPLAQRCGMSQSAVNGIWRAFALHPHRSKTFKLSPDPLFIEKVRDLAGLDLTPPKRALVPGVDEKAQIQALDWTQPLLPMRPGPIERRTHNYQGHGTRRCLPLWRSPAAK